MSWKTWAMLVRSASFPSTAEPSPPMPNANPKNRPEMSPTLPGRSSCAYTRIAGNAEDRTTPMQIDSDRRSGEARVGEQERERRGAEDGYPDHVLAADFVPDGTPDERPRGHGELEDEQVELR